MEFIEGKLLVSDEIYNQLLKKILSGYWGVGEKLPSEKQLCDMFSASRVSVRAALQKLQANDLITTRQGVGSIIKAPQTQIAFAQYTKSDISEEFFKQFVEFRTMLEFKAVDLIIAQYDYTAISKVETALRAFAEHAHEGQAELDKYDYEFHMAIINHCGNEFIIKTMELYKDVFFHYIEEVHRLAPMPLEHLIADHQTMFDAIVKKRADVMQKIILEDMVLYQKMCFAEAKE